MHKLLKFWFIVTFPIVYYRNDVQQISVAIDFSIVKSITNIYNY